MDERTKNPEHSLAVMEATRIISEHKKGRFYRFVKKIATNETVSYPTTLLTGASLSLTLSFLSHEAGVTLLANITSNPTASSLIRQPDWALAGFAGVLTSDFIYRNFIRR